MSVNTCLIYRCLSSASVVIRSWFIYELQKSKTIAFSRNSLYTFYSRNPTCGIPPCLRISNRKYPPCPQNSIIVNPPSPSEILKAVRGMVWIFSGIAQFTIAKITTTTVAIISSFKHDTDHYLGEGLPVIQHIQAFTSFVKNKFTSGAWDAGDNVWWS